MNVDGCRELTCPQHGSRNRAERDGARSCVCCGRPSRLGYKVERGEMHADCWHEHHSSPLASEQPWPADHKCADGVGQ